ncbi:Elongation of very long chain fatty acids protein 2 [Thelohanellus kitauei]|uniref:Elongation of very long chain fatty acids protein n=1 Tax=Thelohanellus kitauei TaxID=669202 RepID=A0A0C2JJR8_THEKT|nr:Elongation of very long chain fatty acids protein 2 [Thelohanellus kitauei]
MWDTIYHRYYKTEDLVKDWPLIDNPLPILTIIVSYLSVALYGQTIMKRFNALGLRSFMFFYNLSVIIWCLLVTVLSLQAVFAVPNFWKVHLGRKLISEAGIGQKFLLVHYLYLLSKIYELLDTIIFVLRKKFNQVSLFHVYHHASILIIEWHHFKTYPGPMAMPLVILNSIVHVFMYGYYFLSSFGPKVQKYLWWKKYITQMQLIQLAIYFAYFTWFRGYTTIYPRGLIDCYILYNFTIFGFFCHFYVKEYRKKNI